MKDASNRRASEHESGGKAMDRRRSGPAYPADLLSELASVDKRDRVKTAEVLAGLPDRISAWLNATRECPECHGEECARDCKACDGAGRLWKPSWARTRADVPHGRRASD